MMDAFLYIYKLKLKLEALQRQYVHQMHHIQVDLLANFFIVVPSSLSFLLQQIKLGLSNVKNV